MSNLVAFMNSFLSYLLLFGAFVLIAAFAVAIGISLRKSKNAKVTKTESSADDVTDNENE